MANVVYDSAKESFISGLIDLTSDDIRAILVDTDDYSFSSLHDFLDDVVAGSRVAVSATFTSKTVTNGVFDAADLVLSAITGDQSEALIIYKHTGVEATSDLLIYMDTGVTGLPVTPNGGDIAITWNASGIFSL